MEAATNYVWVIFVVKNNVQFPNFFPIGVYLTESEAKEQIFNLSKDNNYQLLKLPVNEFFGYCNNKGELVGMDRINHWHYHFKDDLEEL